MNVPIKPLFVLAQFSALAILAGPAAGETRASRQTDPQVAVEEQQKAAMPVYRPRYRGAPAGRVGGGSRGTAAGEPVLEVLAPDHTGLAASSRPSLYWYLSEAVSAPAEVVVIEMDERVVHPLLEVQRDPPQQPGVHRLGLADYEVSLRPGVEYRWSVALVADPQQRSLDVLAWGLVEHVPPAADLAAQLDAARPRERVHLYAAAGYWYDAIAVLGDLISRHPTDRALHAQRVALLEQVGLPGAAAHDERLD